MKPFTWNVNIKGVLTTVLIEIDLDRIAVDVATRAAENKTGKARAFGGLIKGKVVRRDA